MKAILQITSAEGSPLCGHIIYAPDAASMAQSVAQITAGYVGYTVTEVATEDEIVNAPAPVLTLP